MSSPTEPIAAGDRQAALRCAETLLATLPAALAEGEEAADAAAEALPLDEFSDADLQLMMTAWSRAYLHRATRRDTPLSPLLGKGLTATEAMLLTSAVLKAVDVAVFELGMWQAWSGRH